VGRPFFSPEGGHLAFVAARGGKSFVVIDGVEGEEKFDGFLKGVPLVWEGKKLVRGQALRLPEPEFFRVEASIKP
jgi:hypothetical protein